MIEKSGTTDFPDKSSGKKIIMFLTRVPYPLQEHGISIRYFPIIEHFSKSHVLDLVIFRPRQDKTESYEVLRKYCRNVSYVQNPKYLVHGIFSKLLTYGRFAVPWSPPLTPVAHGAGALQRVITQQAGKDRYDVLLWVGTLLLPHLLSAMPLKNVGRYLVDFIDSPSLIKQRWKRDTFRFDFLERYDLWKTIRWEGEVIRKMDDTIYISDVDSRTVPDALTPGKRRHVVPNGVDFRSYTPDIVAGIVSPSIGFLGNMAYSPNVEAVTWLFREVFLPLKEQVAGLSLILIGRDPVEPILKLRECPGVTVTGTVENIWPYVNSVDLFLFPLWTGAGLKNKILESMYAGRPVITTPIGNEGINAVSGRDILVRHDTAGFQEEALRLLNSPEDRRRMGDHARDFVRHGFSWPPILKAYEEIVTGYVSPGRP
jgi:glycosyltransferase involved in cell wall biosynthesis